MALTYTFYFSKANWTMLLADVVNIQLLTTITVSLWKQFTPTFIGKIDGKLQQVTCETFSSLHT